MNQIRLELLVGKAIYVHDCYQCSNYGFQIIQDRR